MSESTEKAQIEVLAGVIHRSRTNVSPICTEDDPESCWPIARAVLLAGYLPGFRPGSEGQS